MRLFHISVWSEHVVNETVVIFLGCDEFFVVNLVETHFLKSTPLVKNSKSWIIHFDVLTNCSNAMSHPIFLSSFPPHSHFVLPRMVAVHQSDWTHFLSTAFFKAHCHLLKQRQKTFPGVSLLRPISFHSQKKTALLLHDVLPHAQECHHN